MSGYKGHSVFALILALMFFQNPLIIALTVIGANIPDFDHKIKKDNVYKLIILGLIVIISLYILKLPYYIGFIITFLGCIFYFSQHRSFTHSVFGVLTLTASVSLILIGSFDILITVTTLGNSYLLMAIIIALLSFLFLNKKLLIVFIPIFFISLFILNNSAINYLEIVLGIFLGVFSHIILDSFTPSGIKIFAPLSSKKVHKNFGLITTFILIIIAIIYHFPILFTLFKQYALNIF